MKSVLLAAGILAAVAANAPSACAADLDYERPDRYSSPYDDPRYRDLYSEPPRYSERYEYQGQGHKPVPPYAYKDVDSPRYTEGHGYDRYTEGPGYNRYAEGNGYNRDCLPRHEIRHRLQSEGWNDFHALDVHSPIALLRARRPNGDVYDLKVDRCTGHVVSARLLDRYVPGPYANEPRRWSRPFF